MLKSTPFVGTSGIFTHRKAPPTRPKDTRLTCTYHPACQLGGNCATPLPSDSPCLVWRERVLFVTKRATRCGSSNNKKPTYSYKFHPIIVLLAVVRRVVVAVPLGYEFFCALISIFSPQRILFLYYLTCDMCLRFRGCPAVLGIELSVSARHQKTRSLLCAPRLVLLLTAAAPRGGVRQKFQNCMQ